MFWPSAVRLALRSIAAWHGPCLLLSRWSCGRRVGVRDLGVKHGYRPAGGPSAPGLSEVAMSHDEHRPHARLSPASVPVDSAAKRCTRSGRAGLTNGKPSSAPFTSCSLGGNETKRRRMRGVLRSLFLLLLLCGGSKFLQFPFSSEAYAAQFDHDLNRIVADLKRRQDQGEFQVVRRAPRPARTTARARARRVA